MNRIHRFFCRSAIWRRQLETRLLPWVLAGTTLGEDVLEIGPGPGLATDLLRHRTARLTSIEIDERLADSLAERMSDDDSVTVVRGDATEMPFEANRFSSAVSLTMLHHVPSPALQDRLLRETFRVLRPGGWLLGSDSLSDPVFSMFHWFDTHVPVEPASFGARLEAAGFRQVEVDASRRAFRFTAMKPR